MQLMSLTSPAADPRFLAAVDAAITSRGSIRAFLPTPVPREAIEQIRDLPGTTSSVRVSRAAKGHS